LPGAALGDGERHYSEETAREIDTQVRRIIDASTGEVRSMVQARRAALEAVARRLIEREVIDGTELRAILTQLGSGPRLAPDSFPEKAARPLAKTDIQDISPP
jgi:cell division protease FtsH